MKTFVFLILKIGSLLITFLSILMTLIKTMRETSNKYIHLKSILNALIFFYLIAITDELQLHYDPVENITIDCGSSGSLTSQDARNWSGDIGSKYFLLEGQNKASVPRLAVEQPTTKDRVPYRTARLSLSEFSYMIPVTPGPKFVRLHFFSSTYENFDPSKAFFSVKAGKYTLLSNFSVSLTAEALGSEGIEKEYIVTIEQSFINITFIPSSSISGAFAIVNGIEVVSMPPSLYYSEAEDRKVKLVGQEDTFNSITNNTALETMCRINIGGNTISPVCDTGMFRQWDQEDDYLTIPGPSVLPLNTTAKLNYKDNISSYAAPEMLYSTARSIGNDPDKSVLRGYKLTWEFPVDSRFSYMLRLHFCEIIKAFTKMGDRVFLIYITNDLVEKTFDIIHLSGGQYVPYFKDYLILMLGNRGDQKKVNLSVALQANPDDDDTKYVDAILNGLEIFKLNDTGSNLAGPNPDPTTSRSKTFSSPTQPKKIKKKSNPTVTTCVVTGVVFCILVASILWFLISRRGRNVKVSSYSDGSSLPSDLCRYFSLAEIRAATNHFDGSFLIGIGGFGNVYKGYIDGGATAVAIKRLKPQSSQGAHEFKTEIEMLSSLRHLNLVSLIGYCNEDAEMILVYDYMARGTLSDHLYNTDNPPLSWKKRLQICIGAASGLDYLHTGVKHMIIHRDVKTSNILLNERLVAKVSDFGLSKVGPTTLSKNHVSTMVKGSFGYFDPEYFRRQQLSEKSDVYSFGVVLCEVLSGRPPILRTVEKKQMSLAQWARRCYQDRALDQIVDPYLTDKIAPECLRQYEEIMMNCMLDNGAERPSMKEVVRELEFAMQLQNNADENIRLGGEHSQMNSDGTVRYYFSWEDSSGAVFSEIKDLQGR